MVGFIPFQEEKCMPSGQITNRERYGKFFMWVSFLCFPCLAGLIALGFKLEYFIESGHLVVDPFIVGVVVVLVLSMILAAFFSDSPPTY